MKTGPKPKSRPKKVCPICNCVFLCPDRGYSYARWMQRITCSVACQKKKLSKQLKNTKRNWKPTNEQLLKQSTSLRKTRKLNPLYGEKASNWQGGITSLSKSIRNSEKYEMWRLRCLLRDSFKCISCGSINRLHVHHIVYLSEIIKKNKIKNKKQAETCKELWNLDNGITVCNKCHSTIHNRYIP